LTSARDREALLLAAGQLGRIGPGDSAQAHRVDKPRHARSCLRPARPEARREADVLLARQLRHEMKGLKDEADMTSAQSPRSARSPAAARAA
jgi:hypothetical protein